MGVDGAAERGAEVQDVTINGVDEEWQHRLYADRDLDTLESR